MGEGWCEIFFLLLLGPGPRTLACNLVTVPPGHMTPQKQYILTMIDKFGLSQVKTVATPADVSVQLQKDDGVSKKVDPMLRYCPSIGNGVEVQLQTW